MYIKLFDKQEKKHKSLEDHLYFTIQDILLNIFGIDLIIEANKYNKLLTNNIPYKHELFRYTRVLRSTTYAKQVYEWLSTIQLRDFEATYDSEDEHDLEESRHISLEDWWTDFELLKTKLQNV
jgi:hypothetical protein